MVSRTLAFGLLAAGCVAAAGGGAYVATRQNAAAASVSAPAVEPAPASAQQPVSETEAVVTPTDRATTGTALVESPAPPARAKATAPETTVSRREGTRNGRTTPRERASVSARPRRTAAPAPAPAPEAPVEQPEAAREAAVPPAATVDPPPEPPRYVEPPAPLEPTFEEVTVPASAVIGLQIETPVTSERAQIEDRVTARVTRDVMSRGRVAIPAGSRVLGSVTLVDKGGKVKERARLGVRFHTLVLADGSELPLRSEPIFREGESPAGDSSRKIGGAAVGGAILGAIFGGGKGAVIGGATGAAGGTAAVMAGDRHPATLASGTILTVRLTSPVDIQVEKR